MYNFTNITYDDIIMAESNRESLNKTAATILVIFATILIKRMIDIFWGSVSYKLLVLIVSLLLAVIQEAKLMPRLGITFSKGRDSISMIVPVLILRITSCWDWSLFKKCLPSIVILSTVGMVLFGLIVGYATYLYESNSDSILWLHLLLYGISFSAIDDVEMSNSYLEYKTIRDALVILDGEYILTTAISIVSMHIGFGFLEGTVSKWYQVLAISIRYFGLGVIVGYPLGWCIALILPYMRNNTSDLSICLLCFVYFVYVVCEYVICCSGTIATFIACTYTTKFMKKLSTQSYSLVRIFVDLTYTLTVYPSFITAFNHEIYLMLRFTEIKHIIQYMATFFTCFFTRILVLAILYPVLKKSGDHLKLNSMIVLFWLSKKGFMQLVAVNSFSSRIVSGWLVTISGNIVFTITMGVIFESIFIKPILKSFERSEAAKNNESKLKKCIDLIHAIQIDLVGTIRSYRLVTDIKWNRVNEVTFLTNPQLSSVKVEVTNTTSLPTFCEECKNEIYIKPNEKDFHQVVRKNKLRVLNAQKVVIQRLFRKNLIEENTAMYILSKLKSSMESGDIAFIKESLLIRLSQRHFMETFKEFLIDIGEEEIVLKPPRKKFRWICYKIVTNKSYHVIMSIICMSYIVAFLCKTATGTQHYTAALENCYTIYFMLEVFIKIMAFSHIHINKGIRYYISNNWNAVEFISMVSNIFITCYFLFQVNRLELWSIRVCMWSIRPFSLLRGLRLIMILYQLRYWIMTIPDKVLFKRKTFSYDIAKALLICHDDIIHMLPTMAIDPDVYDHIIGLLESERLKIQKIICDLNLFSSSYISIHHTTVVHQDTINFLTTSAAHLKKNGFLDYQEYNELIHIFEKQRKSKLKVPILLKARYVFKNILWLQNTRVYNMVKKIAAEVSWKKNDVIVEAGKPISEVIVLTEGVLMSHYEPTTESLEQHRKYGILPIADYHDYKKLAAKVSKCLIPGSSIGLLGVLTGRIYDATVVAPTEGRGVVIPQVFFLENLNECTDPTNGFYSTLWKIVSFDIAHWLLWESKYYRRKTRQELDTYMHRSFVPYLCNRKAFVVDELVKDVVLIEGLVEDMASKMVFSGPVFMPRGVKYLKLLREQDMAEPILWIVPTRNAVISKILKYNDFEALKIFNTTAV